MGHTYSSLLYHCVFSTKERRPLLTPELRERLWPYMGGIARENRIRALTIGGTDDHLHMLLSLPTSLCIADALKAIKACSSKWVSETFRDHDKFQWQEGYGAFTVSISHKPETIAYIGRQEKHHRRKTFKEEFVEFLKRHEIQYDEERIWE